MVEAPPASPFEMIEPQLVLELLVVPLDTPAQHREADQIRPRRRRRQRGQPILDRCGFGARPLDEQPLLGARRRTPVVAVRGPHADRREARPHRAPCSLAPRHGTPRPRRQLLGQCPHAEWSMSPCAADQGRWPALASILRRWQRRAAGRPHGRLGADANDIRNGPCRQRIAKGGDHAVASIRDDRRGRHALGHDLRHLLERDLPFGAELDGVGDAGDRKSTRLNSSHGSISYAVFCLKKKKKNKTRYPRYDFAYTSVSKS